jgi:F0F1-type ATP synthase membrane subunit b/b'
MKPIETGDELEALAGLREHERELDQQLEDARQEAAKLLAGAHQAAEHLKQESEAALSEEVQRLRQASASELEQALVAVREATARRSEARRPGGTGNARWTSCCPG